MPSEHFVNMTKLELQNAICQRCAFLKEYNVALKVSVPLDDYGPILSKLQLDKALVILMIDLTDFPCSIWPGLVNIINDKQSVLVVGNKVDLLPKDGDDYLERIKATLMQNLTDIGIDRGNNIIDIRLISAFTGHGIEELITSIQHNWGTSGKE